MSRAFARAEAGFDECELWENLLILAIRYCWLDGERQVFECEQGVVMEVSRFVTRFRSTSPTF